MTQLNFGYGTSGPASFLLKQLNRHALIAGATGTGKTVTLKVLAEQLSAAGIPIFLSDIKGDLMSIAQANTTNSSDPSLEQRLEATHYTDYQPTAYPVEIWDANGLEGLPLRMTISQMGPILLSRLLGLNETQTGILNIAFHVADEQGLLLIDLADLRAILNYVGEHAKDLSAYYGTISTRSIGVILRSLITIENQGVGNFFGEPALELTDLLRVDTDGRGIVNILNAKTLFAQPTLYSIILLAVLSELFENLDEVGDLDQPKLVFFFDEAHLLFKDTPKVLVEKIELVVRLIRSKGVAVFFITQNPLDIPQAILSQVGSRIQHNLRAYTPNEIKNLRAISDSFRQEAGTDIAEIIQTLTVGEAVVSTLGEDGAPSLAERVLIYPPQSLIGTLDTSTLLALINQSDLGDKYGESINRESAHEQILARIADQEAALLEAAESKPDTKEADVAHKEAGSLLDSLADSLDGSGRNKRSTRRTDSNFDRFTKNLMSQVGREVGRVISRGITGMFKK